MSLAWMMEKCDGDCATWECIKILCCPLQGGGGQGREGVKEGPGCRGGLGGGTALDTYTEVGKHNTKVMMCIYVLCQIVMELFWDLAAAGLRG